MRSVIRFVLAVALGLAWVALPSVSVAQVQRLADPVPTSSTASKKPPKIKQHGREGIKKGKIKKASEYEYSADGLDSTLVSTTDFDYHGNALKKVLKLKDADGHEVDAVDSTVVDTVLDLITRTVDGRTGLSTDISYDGDQAYDKMSIKKNGHEMQSIKYDYDPTDGRLTKIRSNLPGDDKLEGDPQPFLVTEFLYYDTDPSMIDDNIHWIVIHDMRGGGDRITSRTHQIFTGNLVTTKQMYNGTPGDADHPEVLLMTKTYEYDAGGNLTKAQTFDKDGVKTFEETHTYDGDGNETGWTLSQPTIVDGVQEQKKKTLTRTFDTNGNLLTETTDEEVAGVKTVLKLKKVKYE